MKRISEMENSVKKNWCLRTNVKRKFLNEHYMELKPDFDAKLYNLFEQQKNRSKHIKGRKIQSIYLNRLLSSVYTESYEAVLGAANSDLYLDENKSEIYWYPDLVYKNIDKDIKDVEVSLRKEYIHLEEFEIFQLKKILLNDDWKLLQEIFLYLLKNSVELIANYSIILEKEIQIFSGDYMDRPEVLEVLRIK